MIEVFKEGTSHYVHGVTCEMAVVAPGSWMQYIKNGWVLDPKKLYPEPPEPPKAEKLKTKEA